MRRPLQVRVADAHEGPVRNVRTRRQGENLIVSYSLAGEEDEYEVALQLSTDGGQTYQDLRGTVNGAVGEEIAPGSVKEITWVALTDYPQGLSGDRYRLRVDAKAVDDGNTLLWVLGGALTAGAGGVVALLLGGGGDDGGLPTPPAPPN
jgi:hypothetical protein